MAAILYICGGGYLNLHLCIDIFLIKYIVYIAVDAIYMFLYMYMSRLIMWPTSGIAWCCFGVYDSINRTNTLAMICTTVDSSRLFSLKLATAHRL